MTSQGRRLPDWRASTAYSAPCSEVAEEGVAGAEREEAEAGAGAGDGIVEQAVDDLEGGAVAADGDKVEAPGGELLAGAHAGVAGGAGLEDVDLQAGLAQAIDGGDGVTATGTAARGGVDDGEEAGRGGHEATYSPRTASRSTLARSSRARGSRLIFCEAVRGNSGSHRR